MICAIIACRIILGRLALWGDLLNTNEQRTKVGHPESVTACIVP